MREILSDGNLTRAIRGAQLSYAVGLGEPRGAASSMSSRTSIVSAAWKSNSGRKTTKKTEALIGNFTSDGIPKSAFGHSRGCGSTYLLSFEAAPPSAVDEAVLGPKRANIPSLRSSR